MLFYTVCMRSNRLAGRSARVVYTIRHCAYDRSSAVHYYQRHDGDDHDDIVMTMTGRR